MNLIVFLTHNFTKEFLKALIRLNSSNISNYEIIVLFDIKNHYNKMIDKLKNIKVVKINLINSSYHPIKL